MSTKSASLLIVDDNEVNLDLLSRWMLRLGEYTVSTAKGGGQALELLETKSFDVVLLDLNMPEVSGRDVLETVRQNYSLSELPIIMLTARGEEVDRLLGLGLGADDYIVKPFSPRELVARVKAVLRRAGNQAQVDGDSLRFDDLRINGRTRVVEDLRGSINLTAREFDLLFHLARRPGQVFTRDQLMDAVWDYEFPGDSSTVTVHMRRLRAKVEPDPTRPRYLKTVWGVGYKFDP